MHVNHLTLALGAFLLLAGPAVAQNTDSKTAASQNEKNASTTGTWQASKIIGLNVYNGSNEKIGDIKQLMLDKEGKIDAVVIGVGGFLGMGERDVAVKFSQLKWSEEPVRSTSSSDKPAGATTGAKTTSDRSNKTYPDHAVLDMNKDQLKSMPQFNYNK